jgi:hypothetical protein
MISRKQAIDLTRQSEYLVYSDINDIAYLIQLHAELGMDEMEIFIEKTSVKKLKKALNKKKFYSRVTEFKSLEHECRLYISWMSNL